MLTVVGMTAVEGAAVGGLHGVMAAGASNETLVAHHQLYSFV